jgi:hypothetical protein
MEIFSIFTLSINKRYEMTNPKTWDELTEEQKDKVRIIADDELNMAILLGDAEQVDVDDLTAEDKEMFERQLKDWYEGDPDAFDI